MHIRITLLSSLSSSHTHMTDHSLLVRTTYCRCGYHTTKCSTRQYSRTPPRWHIYKWSTTTTYKTKMSETFCLLVIHLLTQVEKYCKGNRSNVKGKYQLYDWCTITLCVFILRKTTCIVIAIRQKHQRSPARLKLDISSETVMQVK